MLVIKCLVVKGVKSINRLSTGDQIVNIFASFRKSGSRNTMLTSEFSPEVEIRPFRACAMHPAIIYYYWNSSFIVDVYVAMGQIPRSTERISSCI